MNRRNFVKKAVTAGGVSFISINSIMALASSKPGHLFEKDWIDDSVLVPAPEDPAKWKEWREELHNWKIKKRAQLNYDGSSYRSKPYEWVSSNFACSFVMMCDTEFYDHATGEYTVKHLISEGIKRYGGYNSVVLWHAYPRIGFDDRNQFDFYRDMPGGLSGLRKVADQFHQNNIKVYIDYNPWDVGTRREQQSDLDALIEIIKSIDADGIFLDTMEKAPEFRKKLDVIKPGIVMEGEGALPAEDIQTHHASWAQWFKDSKVPGVYRNKWFEPCHMQHAIARLSNDKSPQLQTAWMNGSGMLIWENVFGLWIGWNERDKSNYRTMYSIQQYFHTLFSGEGWTPLALESKVSGVYINLWEEDGVQLWTLVNRNEIPVEGELMTTIFQNSVRYFDLVKGEEISEGIDNNEVRFNGSIGGRGIGCFLSADRTKVNPGFNRFLKKQKKLFNLFSADTSIPVKNVQRVALVPSKKYPAPLKGMVAIPAASLNLNLEYTFNEIGSYDTTQDYIALKATNNLFKPSRFTRNVELGRYAIDETPVTNAMWKEFISQGGYKPRFSANYLKHWINGQIPPGKEDHPVVYIDQDDAHAYASWAGKRLPTEFEWQYAAQGPDALNYPWGNEMRPGKCNPDLNGETTPVKAFQESVSPFGCYDMCGNTWELTDSEHSDGRTRFLMLKGGSCYKARGSEWYTDGGPQKNNFLAKMLLMWAGIDRCATIGFRCAVDLT